MVPLFQKAGGGTVVELEPGDVDELIELFETIADEEGWQPGDQLRAVHSNVRHLAVMVKDGLSGGMQIVLPDHGGVLPYQAVWPDIQIADANRAAEVTVLAITKPHRGRAGIFWPLCAELWRLCVRDRVETLVLEATPGMYNKYCKVGWPLEIVGELRVHWGEDCYLCTMDVRAVAGSLLQLALKSPSYRVLIDQALRPGCNPRCRSAVALA